MIKIKVKEFSEPSICQKLWLFNEEYIKLTEIKKEDSIIIKELQRDLEQLGDHSDGQNETAPNGGKNDL